MRKVETFRTPFNEISFLRGDGRFLIVMVEQDGTEVTRVIAGKNLKYYDSVDEWENHDH